MSLFRKVIFGLIAFLDIVLRYAANGAMVVSVRSIGLWAFPAYFGLGMLWTGLVFFLLVPPKSTKQFSYGGSPWLKKRLEMDPSRFRSPTWKWIAAKGQMVLVTASVIFLGSLPAALLIRFFGYRERKAWLYAFVANALATVIVVALSFGIANLVYNLTHRL